MGSSQCGQAPTRCPATQARIPRAIDRCDLPVPGGPANTAFDLASMKSSTPRWATNVGADAALVVEIEVFQRFAGREPGGPDARLAAVGLAGGHLPSKQAAWNSS